MERTIRLPTGHQVLALANFSVIPAMMGYLESTGQQNATKAVVCAASLVVLSYGAVRVALEAHCTGQHHYKRDEADKPYVSG